jgi:hypothetical protein
MTPGAKLIALAAFSLLPAAAQAQSYTQPGYPQPAYPRAAGGDVAYCQALSGMYVRYIGHDWQYGNYSRRRANNDAQVASTQCQTNTAYAIPILERELRTSGFTLPARG